MALVTSQKGINLIKEFESCRLKTYQDPARVWTIDYGHTEGVSSGMTISQAQAEACMRYTINTSVHRECCSIIGDLFLEQHSIF